MSKKYFGTDGIRGRVGQYPITPDFMLKLGWAAGMAKLSKSAGQTALRRTRSGSTTATRLSSFPAGISSSIVNSHLLNERIHSPAVRWSAPASWSP